MFCRAAGRSAELERDLRNPGRSEKLKGGLLGSRVLCRALRRPADLYFLTSQFFFYIYLMLPVFFVLAQCEELLHVKTTSEVDGSAQ
jgi:hypothetical protein